MRMLSALGVSAATGAGPGLGSRAATGTCTVVVLPAVLLCASLAAANAQSLFHWQQARCADIGQRLVAVSVACPTGLDPATCSLGCAAALLPLVYNASCTSALNAMADVSGSYESDDFTATAVYAFADKCTQQLTANITELKARGCVVNDNGVTAGALPAAGSALPSAAVAAGATESWQRRSMFATIDASADKCPRPLFNKKLAELHTRCCGEQANCASGDGGGMPRSCSPACARFYRGFFQDCSALIRCDIGSQMS